MPHVLHVCLSIRPPLVRPLTFISHSFALACVHLASLILELRCRQGLHSRASKRHQ